MPKSELLVKKQITPDGRVVKDINDVHVYGVPQSQAFERPVNEHSLPNIAGQRDYPVNALGPVLGGAAAAIASTVKAPTEIAAHSVLTTAAFACQEKANVIIDGRSIPLSLFVITVAESGDRKSACDKVASKPISEWQRRKVKEHAETFLEYQKEKDLYDAAYKQAISSKKTHDMERLIPPTPPLEPIAICQEPTLEGLQKSFRFGYPSQALFNDEGTQFFGGHGMNKDNRAKTIAGLSKFWDGAPISRTRAGQGETALMYDRRLSIHMLLQPVIAKEILNDRLLLEQGWLARFLIAESRSIAGTRMYQPVNAMEHPDVTRFYRAISRLLNTAPQIEDDGGLSLPNIELSAQAKAYWIEAYDQVERQLLPGESLEQIRAVAGKAAENANRLAGIFAVVENTEAITEDQMERAWTLTTYYLQNALRTSQVSQASESERASIEVFEWLKAQPQDVIQIDDIQKRVIPSRHRKSVNAIRALMDRLVLAEKVVLVEFNTRGQPSAWRVMP